MENCETSADRVRARILEARAGTVSNLYATLLSSPPVCEAWLELGTALRWRSDLPDALRELVTCFVAVHTRSAYAWGHHAPLARAAGVDPEVLAGLPQWRALSSLSLIEVHVLAHAEHVLNLDHVPTEVSAAIEAELGETGLVELTALVAYYAGVARFLHALQVPFEDPAYLERHPLPTAAAT